MTPKATDWLQSLHARRDSVKMIADATSVYLLPGMVENDPDAARQAIKLLIDAMNQENKSLNDLAEMYLKSIDDTQEIMQIIRNAGK